jgi:two-component system chemotaxis sensor kinase CheA
MHYNPVETFLAEAEELLAEIEHAALALGAGDRTEERVHQLFRAFHTIKGSGAMCGLDAVAGFTHHVESMLGHVRDGALPVSQELVELILAARDHIATMLAAEHAGETVPQGSSDRLLERLEEFSERPASGVQGAAEQKQQPAPSGQPRPWNIRFRPDRELLACGGNPAALFRDLGRLGPCEIKADTDDVPALDEIRPDHCYLSWSIALQTAADANAIRDVFIFVEDGSELHIEPALQDFAAGAPQRSGGEEHKAVSQGGRRALAKESTVRVPAARLDRLVNLVGELVMNQSRLTEATARVGAPELANPVQELERLVAELRDDVLGIRMLPIGTLFGRFRRLVHDLSAELGKEVDLILEGAETELDKSVLEQLGEPLVHLLRNAIDHGIETADQRAAAGKPRRGMIRLSAVHTGSDVVVSIEDDGRGIDRAAVLARAVEKQLIAADAKLSDRDVCNLIEQPGFSTAREVTSVSGRGVGMDVVKRQIDALRGSLSFASEDGRGTRLAITLPLTLAIIDGLLVQVGCDQLIIPMAAVTENVELHREQRMRGNGRNVIAVRGELIPYIDLRATFQMQGGAPAIEKVVIVRHEEHRVGLVVDRVVGTHQTVIQSLGRFFRQIEVVSGATIMGDGRVALILDIASAVRLADRQSQMEPAA